MIFKLFRAGLTLNKLGTTKNTFLFDKLKNVHKSFKNVTNSNTTASTATVNAVATSKTANKVIGFWLAGCAGMVSGAVNTIHQNEHFFLMFFNVPIFR